MELIYQVSCDYELEEKHHVDEGSYFSPSQHHHSALGTQSSTQLLNQFYCSFRKIID